MNQEILNLAKTILQEEEDFMIPAAKLFNLIMQEKENLDLQYDDFLQSLKEDNELKIIDSASTQEPWPDEDDDAMQALGYYKGPRVMLKSRIPSKQELMQTMAEKMQDTMSALKSAYKVKPDNMTDDEEEEFLQILKKTKDLQKKLQNQSKSK